MGEEYLDLIDGDHDLYNDSWVSYSVDRDRLEVTVRNKFKENESYTWLLVPIAT